MADLAWIKRTVDTGGRPCPMRLGERCPGERSGCAFWLAETLRDHAGNVESIEGCSIMFGYIAHHESVLESVRTQAAINASASSMKDAADKLGHAVVTHGLLLRDTRQRAIGGG